jgi:hypothetical protein
MTKSIEAVLAEAEELISRHKYNDAYNNLISLFQQCSRFDIERLHEPIKEIIGRFMPKKRRMLGEEIASRIQSSDKGAYSDADAVSDFPRQIEHRIPLNEFIESVTGRFAELSEWHIFQWSTYYRDELKAISADTVEFLRSDNQPDAAFDAVGEAIRAHSSEIFSKGFDRLMSQGRATQEAAVAKSLGGLRSFLALPVEIYAEDSSRISEPKGCRALRRITSRMLQGILTGFIASRLGEIEAQELLVRTIKSWAHVLPLLEQSDLQLLTQSIDLGATASILGRPLELLVQELDHASSKSSVDAVVVTSAQVNIDESSIDITLRPPADSSDTKPLEIAVLGGGGLLKHQIERRAKLGYIACMTPQPVQEYWKGTFPTKEVKEIVVQMPTAGSNPVGFLLSRLRLRFYENTVVVQPSVPLKTNIAERFPLESPSQMSYFRVERPSVRALQTTLSTRTGVLLWCSVRRSGKTTGVSELASGIADRNAVFQRCEMTGGDKTSRMLYEEVCDALDRAVQLPRDFMRSIVSRAAPMGQEENRGSILIVDEYDRLFSRLKVIGRRSEDARILVVQPLLDQLVEFATENLLILLGQQPNAHFIFMDQNQLSAYVQQEPYPLFEHRTGTVGSEFHELVRRTFQQTLVFDTTFVDAVFEETGGHPFLAVNLLRDIVDWLIKRKAIPGSTTLTRAFYNEYAAEELTVVAIGKSKHYKFFRGAASEALSEAGIEQGPWLHVAYRLLRYLAASIDATGAMSFEQAESYVDSTLSKSGLGTYTGNSFLASAAESNFVEFVDDKVRAKIPLLARISAAVGVNH